LWMLPWLSMSRWPSACLWVLGMDPVYLSESEYG
jgi:hypothetical protein